MEKEGRTRLALIICNKKFDYLFDRDNADTDILNMQELLENLGYSVVLKENLTAQVMSPEIGATFFVLLSNSLWVATRRNYICFRAEFLSFDLLQSVVS
jgi:hypothetical protein